MSASTSGQGPAAERFGPYIEELQEFFASSCLRYGTPEDILDLTERVDSSSAFAEDLSSMVRSIVLREGGALPHSQLLEILALAIGGPRMDHAAQQFSQPLRYLLSFIGGVLRRAWNEPPGDAPRTAQHAPVDYPRQHHQAEIVPFPVRPRVSGERFGSQAAGISAAADRAAHEGGTGTRFGENEQRFGHVNDSFSSAEPFAEGSFDPDESSVSAAETYTGDSGEDDLQSGEAPGPHIVRPTLATASAPESLHEHLRHQRSIPDPVGEPTPAERSALDPSSPAREAIEDPDLPGSRDEDLSPAAAAPSPEFPTPSWQRAAEAVRKGEVVPVIAPAVPQSPQLNSQPNPQPSPAASANPAPRFAAPASAFEPVRSQPPAPAFMQSTMRPSSRLNPEIPPAHILSPSFKPRLPRTPAGILVAGAAMLVVAGIVAASVNRTTELVGKQLPPSQTAPSAAAAVPSASTVAAKPAAGLQAASAAPAPRMRRVVSTDDDEDSDVAPPYSTPIPGSPTVSQELPAKPSPYVTPSAAASEVHAARPPSNEVASTGPIPAPPATPGHEIQQSYVGASPAIHTYRDPDSAIVGDFRGTRPIVEPRIRNVDVSSGTMGGNLISAPTPDYPTLARLAHVSGEVVIQAVVGRNGNVLATHVLSGNHLLRGAAQDAVRRWRFKPYLMDGRAVEVSTIVTVRFNPHG